MERPKLTPAEERAYLELARAARRLKRAQERAQKQRARKRAKGVADEN